jgi:flagellar basal body-associated protein FliL
MSGPSSAWNPSKPEPTVAVKAAGGNRVAIVLVLVILLIAVALTFMFFGVGTESSERSDPTTTTLQ